MGFFSRLIKNGIRRGISDALGKTIRESTEREATKIINSAEKAERSTEKTADATEKRVEAVASVSGYGGWSAQLSKYPVWECGGESFDEEEVEGVRYFTACFSNADEARNAVKKYREVLKQNGFIAVGESATEENFTKTMDGKCYIVDTEHCFDSDDKAATIGFVECELNKR